MTLEQTIQYAAELAGQGNVSADKDLDIGAEEDFPEYLAPYPNEFSCRLKDPGQFDRFTRGTRNHKGKEYSVIYGWKGDKSEDQAYRYKKTIWTAAEARKHCESHGGRFEAATDKSSKEEKMTLAELKEKHPDLYQQVFDAGKAEVNEKEVKLETEIATLKTSIDAMTQENSDLKAKNLQLDKDLTIEKMTSKAKEEKAQADTIMSKILEASGIAESLHDKVRAMVDCNKFKTADGAFDVEAFTTAFSAEVADWEGKVPAGTNLGAGLAKTDDHDTTPKGTYSEENVEILSNYKKNK
jgi:hypothetical protein